MNVSKAFMLALAALGLGVYSAHGLDVVLSGADGDEVAGPLQSVKADAGLEVGGKTVKLEDIAEVRVKGAALAASTAKAKILLRNGDAIQADIVQGNDTALKANQPLLGELNLKNNALKGIVFALKDAPAETVVAAFFAGADADEDKMLTPKGETVNGFMGGFNDKEMVFEAGGQKRSIPYDQVAAFRYAALERFKPVEGLWAAVRLTDGSIVGGRLTGFAEGSLSVDSGDGIVMKVPEKALLSIEIKGGKLTYLAELTPQAEEKPYVGGVPVVRPWRRNLAVSGEKLRLGRKEYNRGIGVHSYCKLTYTLDGAYDRFLSDVGLDASAPSSAVCSYKIMADGKELEAGDVKSGDAAKKIKVSVMGAKSLELICDYGPDNDDAGDHLDWADARLLK
ncbi:MAG: NPCBM/NEW2 domain-containing protein [Planctomycetes bacterium]|nr:NPCBM/NEW2 domain-containing protein [Planctomycetota bacterium]